MKTTLKTVALFVAFAAFTTACSDQTKQNAEATADSAANDVSNAADEAANATSNAAADVKDDMAPEAGDTAVVQNREADKLIEETPKR